MNTFVFNLLTILLYLAATTQLCFERDDQKGCPNRRLLLFLGGVALLTHALLLNQGVLTQQGLSLGLFNAASLITWVIGLLLLMALWFRPVDNLALVVFPLAALSVALAGYFPGSRVLPEDTPVGVKIHILSSILAYSLLCLSAFQALFLALQDHQLHNRHPARVMQFLPPLQVMEELLVQILVVGFLMLSLSLLSGVVFLEDIFAQHLVHKTVLSLIAWILFGLLIWGRFRHGWRGGTLIRWNLSGFFLLMLAYFGSKLVLELILGRQ